MDSYAERQVMLNRVGLEGGRLQV